MPETIKMLDDRIASKHLLNHPFYVAWGKGQLSLDDLRHYARQYFAHVRAFPAYLSEMHSRCEDLDTRHIIAGNLADEEAQLPTHPELWLDFAAGLGVSRESVMNASIGPKVRALVKTFVSVARMDTGLAAAGLYCYEKQIPTVAASKIAGLESNYGIRDLQTLRYFTIHQSADVEHAAQWESVLSRNQPDEKTAARVADRVLDALWAALTEIHGNCDHRDAAASALA